MIALKRIQPRHAGRGEVVRRFVREAEVCGRLQHPGIVPVYDLGRDADGQSPRGRR
jgi:serine/threonine-protein kinase